MVPRGSSILALLVAVATVAACAQLAGIDEASLDTELPDRGEPPASDAATESTAPKPDATAAVDAAPADAAPKGNWFQANGKDCGPFCTGRGMTNVASVEGAKCTSGENIPASALAAGIQYDECFPDCKAHSGMNPTSSGSDCYAMGQSKDSDPSDETRGCFCR